MCECGICDCGIAASVICNSQFVMIHDSAVCKGGLPFRFPVPVPFVDANLYVVAERVMGIGIVVGVLAMLVAEVVGPRVLHRLPVLPDLRFNNSATRSCDPHERVLHRLPVLPDLQQAVSE